MILTRTGIQGTTATAAYRDSTKFPATLLAVWPRRQMSGGRGVGEGVGGAVRSGQAKDWEVKKTQVRKEDLTRKDLEEKISSLSRKELRGSSKFGEGDLNLNFSQPEKQETDLLDMVDLSSPSNSTCTTAPSYLELKVLPHNIGFKNNGNTCYMNSAIQALLGLNMFVEKMKMYADDGQGLLQAFSQLCLACTKGEMVIANQGMIEMKRQFELMDKQFEGSKMQDSSEFLCKALEKMSEIEKQRLSSIPKLTLTMGELDIVANYFQHVKEVTIVCHGCKSETKCKQSDMTMWSDTVSMSIMTRTRSMSLQQLLEQSLAEEVIERRCDKCGCEEATTSCRLLKLPRVLIIILKRFSYSEQDQTVSNKVSRLVDIPETLSLSLVADTVSLPSPSLSHDDDTLTSTPAKTGHATTLVETPAKFKWLDVEKVESLNEEDQYEYMLYVSRKEAVDNQMNRSGADEDADLKAALEASMREDHFNHSDQSGGFDNVMSGGFPASTSARKRSYGQLGGGLFTHGDGDRSREKINKAMDYMDLKENDAAKERAKVHKTTNPRSRVRSSPRKKQEAKVPRPKSKDQEEADLQRALDLSRQEHESVLEDTTFEWAMEDVENNNTQEVARPEHSYQLHSVVSHLGAGARSGHYVADVFRFDGGGWLRYDDARITRTNGVAVRTGANTANGYILTYLHQIDWEEGKREAERINSNKS